MKVFPITARNINRITYDNNHTLEIYFKNGVIQQYYHVPEILIKRMQLTPSADRWYNKYIKRKYPVQQRIAPQN